MNKRTRVLMAMLPVAALLLLIGDVSAQGQADPSDGSDVDLTVKTDKSLSGPQRIAWIEEQMVTVKGIYRRVQNMLDTARQEKDTIKITCLDDKLTQIHVNMRGIEERKEAMEVAIRAGDTSTSDQQYTILKIYVSRVQGLRAEAEHCIGDTDVVIGESDTVVEIDEDITIEDPSETVIVEVGVEQPVHASGYF